MLLWRVAWRKESWEKSGRRLHVSGKMCQVGRHRLTEAVREGSLLLRWVSHHAFQWEFGKRNRSVGFPPRTFSFSLCTWSNPGVSIKGGSARSWCRTWRSIAAWMLLLLPSPNTVSIFKSCSHLSNVTAPHILSSTDLHQLPQQPNSGSSDDNQPKLCFNPVMKFDKPLSFSHSHLRFSGVREKQAYFLHKWGDLGFWCRTWVYGTSSSCSQSLSFHIQLKCQRFVKSNLCI